MQGRYGLPDEILVFLIGRASDGQPLQRRAARLLLECLRAHKGPAEIGECLDAMDGTTPRLAQAARILAGSAGIKLV